MRFAWEALLSAATSEERESLLVAGAKLFEFVDRVSSEFAATLADGWPTSEAGSDEERANRMIARLVRGERPTADDTDFSERIGFRLGASTQPFVVATPREAAHGSASTALWLRSSGVLAMVRGRLVQGLAETPLVDAMTGLGGEFVLAQAEALPLSHIGDALRDLRLVAKAAIASGQRGAVSTEEYLPLLLVNRSPEVAARLHARVYGPLNGELTQTLDVLVERGFDRNAAAPALPVHRNTLINRLHRIRELTGIDLDGPQGCALVWLAWLERRQRASDWAI